MTPADDGGAVGSLANGSAGGATAAALFAGDCMTGSTAAAGAGAASWAGADGLGGGCRSAWFFAGLLLAARGAVWGFAACGSPVTDFSANCPDPFEPSGGFGAGSRRVVMLSITI